MVEYSAIYDINNIIIWVYSVIIISSIIIILIISIYRSNNTHTNVFILFEHQI